MVVRKSAKIFVVVAVVHFQSTVQAWQMQLRVINGLFLWHQPEKIRFV